MRKFCFHSLIRLVLPASLILPSIGVGKDIAPDDLAFFESRIRPLLSQECYECHSAQSKKLEGGLLLDRKAGWGKGGDSGEVIVPGKPEESLLIRMVERDPDFEAMPPKTALSSGQVAELREWIQRGAPDPRLEAIGDAVLQSEFDLEERKSWWSLQPVAKVAVPGVKQTGRIANDVDRFIQAEIEKRGWQMSEPAKKEHLLRRVSLILTGLAPTEKELADFLADESAKAYEKVVDRLVASSHFGERWARHWMDVVRFAETKAFEADYTIPYVHRYRDYLIRAFNNDVPFNQFVREALAGDLLSVPRLDAESGNNASVVGPGFLYLTGGQHGPPDIHGDEARVFDDIIKVSGVAFQGLTLACARCHDHKFDAITDKDYYSFYGMLRSSRLHYANTANPVKRKAVAEQVRAEKRKVMAALFGGLEAEVPSLPGVIEAVQTIRAGDEHKAPVARLNAKLEKGETREQRVEDFKKSLRAQLDAPGSKKNCDPEILLQWLLFDASKEVPPELAVLKGLLAGATLDEFRKRTRRRESSNPRYSFGLTDKSFGEWIASGSVLQSTAGDGFLLSRDGRRPIRAAVGSGAMTGTLSGRLDGVIRSPDFILDGKPVDLWARGKNAAVHLVVRNYELVGYGTTTNGLRVAVDSDRWKKISFNTDLWEGESAYLEVLHHGPGMICVHRNVGPADLADDAWVAVTAGELPAWDEIWLEAEAGQKTNAVVIVRVIRQLIARAREGALDLAEREVLGALIASGAMGSGLGNNLVLDQKLKMFWHYADRVPRPVYVRSITDGQQHDQPVHVRGDHKNISSELNPRHFLDGLGGAKLSSSGSGRLEWANHVASPDNPLTARVRVNRIWSRIFGRGLVASVDDFGKMGDLPTHPDLLDFLAGDFVENGWSTKALIRKLVLSKTFQTSSTPRPAMAEADPKNAYLTHMPLMRMEAEAIRDHILACSGELNCDLFGPSVPANIDDQPNSRAKPGSGPLNGNGRRSLYVETRRNYLSSFLRVFDMPNATEPVGNRNVTNVPAQSLALLNDRFVHEQSQIWAKRIMGREGTTDDRMRILHRQAFGREVTEAELQWGRDALEELGGSASPEKAWTALCHLMINRKEFIFVF